jgi:iron complex outermembrane receptor protein
MIRTWPSLLVAVSFSALSVAAEAKDVASPEVDPVDASAPGIAPTVATQTEAADVRDIVVTAQRRAQNLTSVPLSISASTGEMLASTGIRQISDIRFNTPGYISQSGAGYTQLYIRGIGNQVYIGADPSVTTFIDDVPHVYGALIEDLVNVERVEILKGAQGGLYGRNATGGVVNIITRQPGDQFAANGRISGGEYGLFQAAAYINVPISDNIAWNVAATRNRHNPYRKNVAYFMPYSGPGTEPYNALARPGKLSEQDFWAIDTKLRLNFSDNFKVTLQGDYNDKHDTAAGEQLDLDPNTTYATYAAFAASVGLTPVAPWPRVTLKSNKVYGAIPNKNWLTDYGGSGKAELSLDGVDITSITAARFQRTTYQADIGGAPVSVAGFYTLFKRHYFYQELRAVSNGQGPLNYLVGATYFQDKINGGIGNIFLGLTFPPTVAITHTKSWSAYGQLSYDFTDRLTLMGSLRFVQEKKSVNYPAPPEITNRVNVHKLIPAATLSYRLDNGTMYARYAKGFKTGGPNPLLRPDQLPADNQVGAIVAPETVDAFEVGYRANLFDRKVQLTTAIFYNKFKNIQATTAGNPENPSIPTALINLKTARTYGAEAAATWRVSQPLTLSANIGYLNGKYQDADFPGNAILAPVFASGKRMRLAPKLQGGFQVHYDQPITDNLRLQTNILYSYVSSHFFSSDETKITEQKGYSLVNGRIGVVTMNDRIGVYAFANNLFDKRYITFGVTNGPFQFAVPGAPRVIGGTIEFKY